MTEYNCKKCRKDLHKGDIVVNTESGIVGTVMEFWHESQELQFLESKGRTGYSQLDKVYVDYHEGQRICGSGWSYSCDLKHVHCV
jgi:hypothetical protein